MLLKRYLRRVFEASEIENRNEILRIVRANAPFRRIVDLGCYDGAFTAQLAEAAQAGEVVGVEFMEEHAAKARARGVTVEVSSLNEPLKFDADRFDLVHANQVIEHLSATDLLLTEAARILRPGGLIIISTNNLASWHNIVSLILGFQPFPSHVSDQIHVGNPLNPRHGSPHADAGQTHLRIFTGRALADLARFHDLEIVDMVASGYYPFPPRLAAKLARIDRRHAAFLIGVFRAPGFSPA